MMTTSIIISQNNDEQIAERRDEKKGHKKVRVGAFVMKRSSEFWGRTRVRVRLAITPCALLMVLMSTRVRRGHEDDPIKREQDEIIENLRSSRDVRMRIEKCLHFWLNTKHH